MKNYLMCTPGPVQISPAAYKALVDPQIPHYGMEWIDTIYNPVQKGLHKLFQTKNDIFTIPSSGSGAIESAFCSLASKDKTVAIFSNGFFGDRMVLIAKAYFGKVLNCSVEYSQAISPEVVSDFLNKHPEVSIVGIVHGETSTGVANDITEISKTVKEKERVLIVDAVATLGGMDVNVDELNIDFCMSASQKGVSASPGLSFISVSDFGYNAMPDREEIPGWYHNLRVWKDAIDEWGVWHPFPVTLPVNVFYSLKKSLDEIHAEGMQNCFERHTRVSAYFRERIQELGATLFCTTPGAEMETVTSFLVPEKCTSPNLLSFLKEEKEILIAGGHAKNKDRMSRVGHMGYNAREEVMDKVLDGIQEFFDKN